MSVPLKWVVSPLHYHQIDNGKQIYMFYYFHMYENLWAYLNSGSCFRHSTQVDI